jgi:hypothetical protein
VSSVTTLSPGSTAAVRAGTNEFLLHRKNATEYFILENRQQTGHDRSLPDMGLAIWHVDELASNNSEQMTAAQLYECSLVQADNRFGLECRANQGTCRTCTAHRLPRGSEAPRNGRKSGLENRVDLCARPADVHDPALAAECSTTERQERVAGGDLPRQLRRRDQSVVR